MTYISEAVKTLKFNQTISVYKDGDLEIYLAHTGLIEVGFTFGGQHSESKVKNTLTYGQIRKAIEAAAEIIYYYHRDRNRTVYCDIYNKDNYTPKREKLAEALGFIPLAPEEFFEVAGDNIWVIPR